MRNKLTYMTVLIACICSHSLSQAESDKTIAASGTSKFAADEQMIQQYAVVAWIEEIDCHIATQATGVFL